MARKRATGIILDAGELAAGPSMPIDTLGGIMQRVEAIRATAKKAGRRAQCPSTHTSPTRSGSSTTFCTLDDGHEGEHRGYRKRWQNDSATKEGM